MKPWEPLVVIAALGALASCSSGDGIDASGDSDRLSVVVAAYPLQFAAERVGGDAVSVTNLTPAGAEPHDLELTPQQVAAVQDADLVVYIGGFQPAVDEAVAQEAGERGLDVGSGLTTLPPSDDEIAEAREEGEPVPASDPHIWLDPTLMASMAASIEQRLSELSSGSTEDFEANLEALQAELADLDTDWEQSTATCQSRDLVVSHEAFGYLVARYDFTQVGLSGLDPEAEPSPSRLAEVADFVRANDVSTIYFETLVDPAVAETIAAETGAATAPLDPLEGVEAGSDDDYLSVMQANLAEVVQGQRCG
jgi:zinc transport system substrate-binding protein